MFKNRFLLVLAVLSVLLVAMAVSYPRSAAPLAPAEGANDIFQRHPEWKAEGANDIFQRHPEWRNNVENAAVPVTGISESPDYFQRHPELRVSMRIALDTSDYFMRHPELRISAQSADLSDYFLRHPELRTR